MEKRNSKAMFLESGLKVSHVVDECPHGREGSFTEENKSNVWVRNA